MALAPTRSACEPFSGFREEGMLARRSLGTRQRFERASGRQSDHSKIVICAVLTRSKGSTGDGGHHSLLPPSPFSEIYILAPPPTIIKRCNILGRGNSTLGRGNNTLGCGNNTLGRGNNTLGGVNNTLGPGNNKGK